MKSQLLLRDFVGIFDKNDLVLGITSLGKHENKLEDTAPFKKRYRQIPSGMYEEVRAHILEMLEIGTIRPSSSHDV